MNDREGFHCWTGMVTILQSRKIPQATKPVGVMSALEEARAARLTITGQSDVKRQINLACAPMFAERVHTYVQLLLRLGVKAVAPVP